MKTFFQMVTSLVVLSCGRMPSLPPTDPPKACDLRAVVSLSIKVLKPDGTPVSNPTGAWTASGRTEPCQAMGNELLCGYEVSGKMTVKVSAPGFVSRTKEADILQGECHVVSQTHNVTLEPQIHFEEDRHYVHTFFSSEADCKAVQVGGLPNCCATVTFQKEGDSTLILSDIANAGTYVISGKDIVFTRILPGDAPEVVTFSKGSDGLLTDDFRKWTWKQSTTTACYSP